MKSTRTWILIADGGRARVLQSEGSAKPLIPLPEMSFHVALPASRELGNDRPGRGHESHGDTRHAYEQRSDPHEALKAAFLKSVVAALESAHEKHLFERLVVVAPAPALGLIRNTLTDGLRHVLLADAAKDLTKNPDHEIRSHLPEHLNI